MTGDFGRYKILAEIGRGGMGIVYQALDQRDNTLVAIKQLVMTNIDPAKEQEFRDRFKREAATASRLKHPNIVTVYDVSTDSGTYFYVMEYLEGHSLRKELELKGGRLTPQQYWPIFAQVVEGLSFAHSMNVVHRDVKPDNIFLLNDGRVKITDFGIARSADDFEQTNLTKTGVMMGTLAYVSPEQLQDAKNVDHRADIFSLGVVSYESLSGVVPFTGDGIAQTIVKIVSQEEKPLHILIPYINLETSAAVTKALRKRARERFRSVKEFARDFQKSLGDQAADISSIAPVSMPAPGSGGGHNTDPGGYQLPESIRQLRNQSAQTDHNTPTDFGQRTNYVGEIDTAQTIAPTSALNFKAPEISLKSRAAPAPQESRPSKPIHIFDTHGKNQAKLVEPSVVCYRSGRVIVGDTATRKVHVYSFEGRWVGDLVVTDTDTKTRGGSLTKPSGIAIDLKGRVYVVDSSDPYVRVFDSKGVFVKEFCNIQGKEGGLQGIAVDSTGLIYLSDITNACIQVFQSELGLWMRKIDCKGKTESDLQLPSGIAIDRANQLYCADYGASRIFVFNKSGSLLRSFGSKGNGPGQFNVPRSVAVDKNDKIYVLDSLNHRIQVFGPTGNLFYIFGGRGSEPGKFIGPSDISIDPENSFLYVADKGNQRIQVFELSQN
ncbi:MAG: 6-bladed beta-propeller [Candidatus Melainabacteria bacterium]|nr:MAG: 6-bladed beta-propeller [Candidatus Melainabacteria bacterium]